jgi:hypothetical protein
MYIFRRRPFSYANVTATLALLFAMSGGALAANHYLISSTKQINPSVLKKLKGSTGATGLTGAAGKEGPAGREGPAGKEGPTGKEGPLGKEGPAGKEGPLGKEGPAGKEGPQGKEGDIAAMKRWRATVATAAVSEAAATPVALATVGPFTVTGKCFAATTNTEAATYVSSSEAGAFGDSYEGTLSAPLPVGEEEELGPPASGVTAEHKPSFRGPGDGSWALESANGSVAVDGFANQGVWLQGAGGPACSFSGYLVQE